MAKLGKRGTRSLSLAFLLCGAIAIPIWSDTPAGARLQAEKDAKPAEQKEFIKGSKEKERRVEAEDLPAAIMRDVDPQTLDLFYGTGGKENVPDDKGPFTFLSEDLKQTSPKFDAKDAQGDRWRVKMGPEARAETAATRLVWGVGYFVDQDYYMAQLKVEGLPKLHRGEKFVSGGIVDSVRLERKGDKDVKELSRWSWFHNPFVGTRELNGLRVVMALINNWDLLTKNNTVYEVDGQRRYVVSDLGASFGHTGNVLSGTKDNLEDYVNSKFISDTKGNTVHFVMRGRPAVLTALEFPYEFGRPGSKEVVQRIPRADAKWIGQKLALLSESQIRDCFRAAGYSPDEVDGFTKVIQERIAQLNAL
jgi:hypothetical protein